MSSKRHKWRWSETGKVGTCKICGGKLKRYVRIEKRSTNTFVYDVYFVPKNGERILLTNNTKMPPCEPRDRGE